MMPKKQKPKPQAKHAPAVIPTATVTIRLPVTVLDRLDELAAKGWGSRATVARLALISGAQSMDLGKEIKDSLAATQELTKRLTALIETATQEGGSA